MRTLFILFFGLLPFRGWAQSNSNTALAYKKAVELPEKLMKEISADYRNAPDEQKKDAEFRKGLDQRYAKAAEMKEKAQYRYIQEHRNDAFSLTVLQEIIPRTTVLLKAQETFASLSKKLQQSAAGKETAAQLSTALLTAVGAIAPDFTQPDSNGKPVKLSDYSGKYILLDFWASWCGPCRAENPNLVHAYATYKDKNFTIFSVSLDQASQKQAWLEAIKTDGLTWTQVSDLGYWNNDAAKKYGIKFLPQNLLIDPDGKIIAKNLKGEDLLKKLAEVLHP